VRDGQWGHGDQLEYDDQWLLRRREVVRSGVYTVSTDHNRPGHGYQDSRQGYYTEVLDITKIVQIPRLSFRVLFLTREGRDGGMI
jgi:hypothetical protein